MYNFQLLLNNSFQLFVLYKEVLIRVWTKEFLPQVLETNIIACAEENILPKVDSLKVIPRIPFRTTRCMLSVGLLKGFLKKDEAFRVYKYFFLKNPNTRFL